MEILYGATGNLLADLVSDGVREIGSTIGVEKDLEKLEKTVNTIKAVLMDAEEQQDTKHQVKDWLRRIKDAVFEAENILDDFATEALRRKVTVRDSTIKMVGIFAYSIRSVAFRFKLRRRIKEIRQTFDEIANDKKNFHFPERVHVDTRVHNAEWRETGSFVVESEVIGRDGDKDNIIKSFLEEHDNLSVIPIRGMGGLGKTTLAQLAYNDQRVTSFDQKMWVCVSEEFDVKELIKRILRSATGSKCPDLDKDQLQSRLQVQLSGKRFLLVLDDVWNENDKLWDELKCLLTSGAKGSKVLVTTRSEKVALIMGTIPTYVLKGLSDDDCWKLFKQKAFAKRREEDNPQLVVIGKEIMRKCGGLPLAAKTLGGILIFKSEVHDWELVRDDEIWRLPQVKNDILPALRLSYNHLPLHLKQCFAYCSIYPKDYEFQKDSLIVSWISHGFLHSSTNSQCLEDIGNDYVKELLWRSFFQEPEKDDYGNLIHFKMHDLICDLARDVAKTECYYQETGKKVEIPEEVRHFGYEDTLSSKTLEALGKISNIRTLAFKGKWLDDSIFSSFKCLRELSLHLRDRSLPSSIGKLKHLRHLILSCSDVETLPKSVNKLLNLHTLDVQFCYDLRELPKDIGKMINLRNIYLNERASLSHMPFGLSNLTSLRSLPLFVVGKRIGSKLNELNGLNHIGGSLRVESLENVRSAGDSAEVNLKEKQKLECLELVWNEQDDHGDVNVEENNLAVLQNLEPHPNLKCLIIWGYRGAQFPLWLQGLQGLTRLEISNCDRLTSLSDGIRYLTSLQTLEIKFCGDMISLADSWGELKSLRSISIAFCDKLQLLPDGMEHLTALQTLVIRECPGLKSWTNGMAQWDECTNGSYHFLYL